MRPKRWQWWFGVVSAILIVWGVAFTTFGLRVLPVDRRVLLPWESALYGAIMIGWGTTLFRVGRVAIRRQDVELLKSLLLGIAVWLAIEAVFSARFRVWFNVGADAAVLALFSVPLIASMRSARRDEGANHGTRDA
ncbi:MAG TPA: hypothetical protein VFK13_05100 [Gemmatimonadaceae bacterium]|nr:hypothetical protein [Gemmatimonadaceae bacterium]